MGGERLYTGEAGPGSTEAIGGGNSLGQKFTISTNGRTVVGGASWVQAGVFFPWWQIWNKDTGVLLREGDITGLSPSGTGWFYFDMASLGAGTTVLTPLALSTGVNYIVNIWSGAQAGDQVYTDGGFSYPFGTSPLSTAGSIYNNGQPRDVAPVFEGFTTGRFYADLTLDSPDNPRPHITVAPSFAVTRAATW